jgi:cytochrome bd-type quinol oxidase subunit 2
VPGLDEFPHGATLVVNPTMLTALPGRPLALIALAVAIAGLAAAVVGSRQRRHLLAFFGSCGFLGGMLAATAACVFPVLLCAIDDESRSLTAYNASVPEAGLRVAFRWWIIGFPLAILYFVTLFRTHRGKAVAATGRDGY